MTRQILIGTDSANSAIAVFACTASKRLSRSSSMARSIPSSCGPAYAFPDATVVDRYACQEEPCVAQPREVCSDQLMPLLACAPLGSEIGGYRSEVFMDGNGSHDFCPPVPGSGRLQERSEALAAVVAHGKVYRKPRAEDFAGTLIFSRDGLHNLSRRTPAGGPESARIGSRLPSMTMAASTEQSSQRLPSSRQDRGL
jgi:hypothetical protein